MPTKNMPVPSQNSGLDASAADVKSASCTLPVAPKSSAMPYSKSADAVELRMRYLSAASREVARSARPHRQ